MKSNQNTSVSRSYISDVVYGSRYNHWQNPLNINYVVSHAGLRGRALAPDFHYCDLGCGDGTTLNMLANLFPAAAFIGVDFNREHIERAQAQAADLGLGNVRYHQHDFAALENLDVPELDFITCVGTFSWINHTLQEAIIDFAGSTLKDGGAFLVHYAAKPGKAQIDPLWHLLRVSSRHIEGISTERAKAGIKTIEYLKKMDALFFKKNPVALARTNAFAEQDINYLAHESLTEWQALYHSDVAESVGHRGMCFAGLQSPTLNEPHLNVPPAFLPMIENCDDPVVRSTLIDYMLNRGLRNDIYVKTSEESPDEEPGISDQTFGLLTLDSGIAPRLSFPSGHVQDYQGAIYQTIIQVLRERTASPNELLEMPALAGFGSEQIHRVISELMFGAQIAPVLAGSGDAQIAPDAKVEPALPITRQILSSRYNLNDTLSLPSATSGQCIEVPPQMAIMLSSLLLGSRQGEIEWVLNRVREAGGLHITGATEELTSGQIDQLVRKEFHHVQEIVLPKLLHLGVYCAV